MKNLLKATLLLTALLSLTCCGAGQIKTEYDSFRDVNIITMEDRYSVDSKFELGGTFINSGTFYTREIFKGKSSPTEMRVVFAGNEKYDRLRPKAVMRIDDKTFNLGMGGLHSVKNTHTTVNDNSNIDTGKTDYGFNNLNTGNDITIRQYSYNELAGTLLLTKKIEDAILSANKVAIRFYAGSKPLTITIEDRVTSSGAKFQKLTNLKQFLKANGS